MRLIELLLIAVVFAASHAASPIVFARVAHFRSWVSSFSGGLAASYVFLHLIPEIDAGGAILGPRIYVVLLLGLAAYYVLEVILHRKRQRRIEAAGGEHGGDAKIHYGASAIYSCLLVFTLSQQLPETAALTVVFTITMGLHLLTTDLGLIERHGTDFVRRGRWILVVAVASGFALGLVREPHEEITDIVTALLAGFVIFTVFRSELPDFAEAHLLPFLGGMGAFLVAHVLLSSAEGTQVS